MKSALGFVCSLLDADEEKTKPVALKKLKGYAFRLAFATYRRC